MTTRLFFLLAGCLFFAHRAVSQTPYLLQDLHQPQEHLLLFVPGDQLSAHGRAYFEARTPLSGEWGLWSFDGQTASMIQNYPSSIDQAIAAEEGFFFFSGIGNSLQALWKTSGAPGEAVLLDTVPLLNPNTLEIPAATLGNWLLFANTSSQHGREIWRSDGTAGGTSLLKDCRPGAANGFPNGLTATDDLVFFTAIDASVKTRLWRSDGTADGTFSVTGDTVAGNLIHAPSMIAVGNTLIFQIRSPLAGIEIWKSDGTAAGTVKVKTVGPPSSLNYLSYVATVADKYLFTLEDGVHGYEWWVSDGTADGTMLLKDINPGPEGIYPQFASKGLYRLNDQFFFFLQNDGENEIWKTDGTPAGTQWVKNIGQGLLSPLPATDHHVFCLLQKNNDDLELWASDGTANGTTVVRTWEDSGYLPNECPSAATGDAVCFFFDQTLDPPFEWVWMRSDGTPAGTGLLSGAPAALYESSNPTRFSAAADGTVYFRAEPESYQHVIWKTDGGTPLSVLPADNDVSFTYTEYGPLMVGEKVAWFASDSVLRVTGAGGAVQQIDLPGRLGGWPGSFAAFQSNLYLITDFGQRLWRSDGTPGGFTLIAEAPDSTQFSGLVATTDSLYFIGDRLSSAGTGIFSHSQRLWRSDGTPAGTAEYEEVSDVGSTLFPIAVNDRFTVSAQVSGVFTERRLIVGGFPALTLPSTPYEPFAGLEVVGDRLFILDARWHDGTGYKHRFWVYEAGQLALLQTFGSVGPYNDFPSEWRDRLHGLPDGRVIFGAGPTNDVELWLGDGTAAGTYEWLDLNPNGSATPDNFVRADAQRRLFTAFDGLATAWWVTDGTTDGTFKVADVLPTQPPLAYTPIPGVSDAFLHGNHLFFSMNDGAHGREPWVLELPDSLVSGAAVVVRPLAGLSIFPNPANAAVQFFWENAAAGEGIATVFDAAGKPVLQRKIALHPGEPATLLFGRLMTSGIYVLSVEDARGVRAVGRFVIEGH